MMDVYSFLDFSPNIHTFVIEHSWPVFFLCSVIVLIGVGNKMGVLYSWSCHVIHL